MAHTGASLIVIITTKHIPIIFLTSTYASGSHSCDTVQRESKRREAIMVAIFRNFKYSYGRVGNFGNGQYHNWFFEFILTIVASYTTYLSGWHTLIQIHDKLQMISNDPGNIFDFIVVGSGSAGGIVANRLSAKYRVLLLEAGADPHPTQNVPIFAFNILNRPEIDWIHKTVPQKYSSLALENQQSIWNQGRSLGGTSNINYMIHNRGNPRDFDNWVRITEDDSWSYENLVPFFKKHEDFVGHWPPGDIHGVGGEMRVEIPSYTSYSDLARIFVQAGQELGYEQSDLNARYSEGFDFVYSPTKNGQRHETYKSFIQPAMQRSNLIIRRFSHVNKILFQGENNDAFAVEYDNYGTRKFAYATKEIILSAGAIKSPQILMLSGVGPKEQLQSLGIPVKKDSPGVGQNLQDHLCTYLGPFLIDYPISYMIPNEYTFAAAIEFFSKGTGAFTNVGTTAQAFIASSKAKLLDGLPTWPDIQLYFIGLGIHKEFAETMSHAFNLRKDISEAYYRHAYGKHAFTIFVSNARPKARGEITLVSSDPYSPPAIQPNYLDNDHDLQVILEGVKKSVELAENTTVFRNIGARFTDERFPGCENIPFRSDAYWECYIRQYSVSLHHITGSCSMGKPEYPNSVVDPQLRVIGTNRLRVIDASVMPTVPVGNTNAPTIMIGEKGADLILRDWDVQNNWPPNNEAISSASDSTPSQSTTAPQNITNSSSTVIRHPIVNATTDHSFSTKVNMGHSSPDYDNIDFQVNPARR